MRQAVKRLARACPRRGVNIKYLDYAQGFCRASCRHQEGVTSSGAVDGTRPHAVKASMGKADLPALLKNISCRFAVNGDMQVKKLLSRKPFDATYSGKAFGSGRNAAERMNIGRAVFCRFESTRFCPPPSRRTFVCRLRRRRRPRRRRRFPWAHFRRRQRAACHNFPQSFAVF